MGWSKIWNEYNRRLSESLPEGMSIKDTKWDELTRQQQDDFKRFYIGDMPYLSRKARVGFLTKIGDMNMDKKIPDWWVFQCDCKTWITDYPFVRCGQCGKTFCGSKEQLENAKKTGGLITLLKSGFGYPNVTELEKELNVSIEIQFVHQFYEPYLEDDNSMDFYP